MDQDLANTQIAAALASLYSASVTQAGMLMKLATAVKEIPDMDIHTQYAINSSLQEMDDLLEAFRTFQTAFDAYRTLVEESVKRGNNG